MNICFQDVSATVPTEGSLANRMANKRKSVAIPVDFALRRSIQSADEVFHFFYMSPLLVCPFPRKPYPFRTHFTANIHF
jgi:hypothetical protein